MTNEENEQVFRPRGRIRVARPVDERSAALHHETDLRFTNTAHPFDRPEVRDYVEKEFPSFSVRLDTAVRPSKSKNPDEVEEWESTRIQKRRDVLENEKIEEYVRRFLYEELFGVNQDPDPVGRSAFMKRGMPGMTIGGLVSHFYTETNSGETDLQDLLALPFQGRTMSDAINSLKAAAVPRTWPRQRQLFFEVQAFTRGNNAPRNAPLQVLGGRRGDQAMMGDAAYQQSHPQIDSVGYRLIALLRAEPRFMQPVADVLLKELIGFSKDHELSRARYFVEAWGYFQQLFDEKGYFKSLENPVAKELFRRLLVIRTHPEMQIFFRFFSPSGYVNEWMGE